MALDWDSFVKEAMERIDLAEFVGQYTVLKKSGSRYMGRCPLHGDKNPSLSVSPDVGLWHCFGCGKGGNIFSFLIEKEGMAFFEAAEFISNRYNIALPKSEKTEVISKKKTVFEAQKIAEDFFSDFLRSTKAQPFRDYLRERKITKGIVEKFNIGASPNEWDLLLGHLRKKGIKEDVILASGLATKSEQGNIYDRFRNRLIIPIKDHLNRTVGFGGRVIGEGEPKYLNSPESSIFKKSEILFAYPLAKDSIRRNDYIIIMEGYTDVMRAHQMGLANAVASMGTALTSNHIEKIAKLTKRVFLAFDGDDAGIAAAVRSTEELIKTDLITRVVIFDEGQDPEEFLRLKGRDEFIKKLKKAKIGIQFLIDSVIPKEVPPAHDERLTILDKTYEYFNLIKDLSEKNKKLTEIAYRLELSADLVRNRYRETQKGARGIEKPIVKAKKTEKEKPSEIESHLMRYIINFCQIRVAIKEHVVPSEFECDTYCKFLTMLFDPDFPIDCDDLQKISQVYGNDDFLTLVSGFMASLDDDYEYTIEGCRMWLAKLKERSIEDKRKKNKRLIYEANQNNDTETVEKLQKENADLACKKEWYRTEFTIDL